MKIIVRIMFPGLSLFSPKMVGIIKIISLPSQPLRRVEEISRLKITY
jgi:hypothetical protein